MPTPLNLSVPRPLNTGTTDTTTTTPTTPALEPQPQPQQPAVRFDDAFAPTSTLRTGVGGRYDREIRAAMDQLTLDTRAALVRPQGEQQDLMRNAAERFVRNLPVGAVLPGLSLPGVNGSTPLGRVPGRTADSLMNELRDRNPTAFYALAASVGGAMGYAAYQNGGRGPDLINLNLFNGGLRVQVAPEFGPQFRDLRATGSVTGRVELAPGAEGNVRLDTEGRWSAEYSWLPRDRNISLYARVGSGQPDFVGNSRGRDDGWHAFIGVRATW